MKVVRKPILGATAIIALSFIVTANIAPTRQAKAGAVAPPVNHAFHGSACKAANLRQALQLAWDQFGARNPNPIGGPSFFVVCPHPRHVTGDVNPEAVGLAVQYDSLNAIPVQCVFRDMDVDEVGASNTAGAIIENFTVITIGSPQTPIDIDGVYFPQPIDSVSETNVWNWVCTLNPQTKVLGYISGD